MLENGSKLLIDTVKIHWNSVDIPETIRALNNVFFSWVAAADWEHKYRSSNSSEFHNLIEFLLDIEPVLADIELAGTAKSDVERNDVNQTPSKESEDKVSIEITKSGWQITVNNNGNKETQTHLVSNGKAALADSRFDDKKIDRSIIDALRGVDLINVSEALNN
ncbi:hypothetical protein CLV93_101216 [Prolixibacter denitrificans]|nr:hypothetical protein CLV93_101216 [Prolixibacter denitrificans]